MLTLCRLLFSSLLSLVRSRAALQAEILPMPRRHEVPRTDFFTPMAEMSQNARTLSRGR
jgi:hypothetical protein